MIEVVRSSDYRLGLEGGISPTVRRKGGARLDSSPRLAPLSLGGPAAQSGTRYDVLHTEHGKGYGLLSMANPKVFSKSQHEALATFRYALRKFLRFSENAAQAAGFTPQQHQALLAIKGYPGRDAVTVGELAERLQLRHHTTVGLVDRLVNQQLVLRTPSAQDRRKVFVCLTPRGENVLGRLSSAHAEQLKRMAPELIHRLQQIAAADE